MMVRPSQLNQAEECPAVPFLAAEFPETNANIERGNSVDEAIDRGLAGVAVDDQDARACIAWLWSAVPADATVLVKQGVKLTDPEAGDTLTEGTPDVQASHADSVETVDWKKREQFYSGHLLGPAENLQLHAYSLGLALKVGASRYRNTIVLFGDGEAEAIQSPWYEGAEWWPFLDRIRAIQKQERAARVGPQCGKCYQRLVCPSNRERTRLAMTVIEDDVKTLALNDQTAAELLERAEAVEAAAELAKKLVRAYVEGGGNVVSNGKRYGTISVPGRKTADVKALEEAGLLQYIKHGGSYKQWRWLKAAR